MLTYALYGLYLYWPSGLKGALQKFGDRAEVSPFIGHIAHSVSGVRDYQKLFTLCAAVLSVVCAFLGLILSILFGTPVGSTIVAVDLAAFGLFSLAGRIRRA